MGDREGAATSRQQVEKASVALHLAVMLSTACSLWAFLAFAYRVESQWTHRDRWPRLDHRRALADESGQSNSTAVRLLIARAYLLIARAYAETNAGGERNRGRKNRTSEDACEVYHRPWLR